AESTLQERERTFTALFSGMSEMVAVHRFVFDDEGRRIDYRIVECNAAFERVIGLPAASVIGRRATEIYGGESPYLAEYSEVAETGVPRVLEVFYPPLEKHFLISVVSSAKDRFSTLTTDVTEMKRAEDRLKAKKKELEQIVYAASHDLRSPLVNVEGYSRELEYSIESLEEALSLDLPCEEREAAARVLLPDMKDSLRRIRSGARQMDSLLAGLLKLSRLRRAALNLDQLDMNSIVSDLVTSMRFQIEKAGASVTVGNLPRCYGDAVQVTQVFSNLLNNALNYLAPARPGEIRIEGVLMNDWSVYSVADNGTGIAPEHQEKVFELFHRLNPSDGSGEGLGLTIVRQILWMMGGDVALESKLGEGSVFKVSMPTAPQERGTKE
ncbi:MAG: ATP-binding protein, partial [Synergistota bacterium]|nr:ATP-binding protein [Synergistota bacterium]